MGKIFNTHIRQALKNKMLYIVLLLTTLFFSAMGFFIEAGSDDEALISACHFIVRSKTMMFSAVYLFSGFSIGAICAGDFSDRTINIEVSSGCTRTEVFFGRSLAAIVITFLGSIFIYAAPLITVTALFGWGDMFTFGEFLPRAVLTMLSVLRSICGFAAIAFFVKNHNIMTAMGGFLFTFSTLGELIFKNAPPALLGFSSGVYLSNYETIPLYQLNGETQLIVDTSLPMENIVSITVVSLIASAVYLLIGSSYFHGDDLR